MKAWLKRFLEKALVREMIVYVIFGILTTIIGFGSYALFIYLGFNVAASNTLSHILAILFAYVTNKIWVFKVRDYSVRKIVPEFLKFVSSRLLAYIIDTALLVLLVDVLLYDPLLSKAGTSVVVVILNYIMSKIIVFRKKKQAES